MSVADGWWRGYVRSWDSASVEQSSTMQFDLIGIFLSPVGDQHTLDGWLINDRGRLGRLASIAN